MGRFLHQSGSQLWALGWSWRKPGNTNHPRKSKASELGKVLAWVKWATNPTNLWSGPGQISKVEPAERKERLLEGRRRNSGPLSLLVTEMTLNHVFCCCCTTTVYTIQISYLILIKNYDISNVALHIFIWQSTNQISWRCIFDLLFKTWSIVSAIIQCYICKGVTSSQRIPEVTAWYFSLLVMTGQHWEMHWALIEDQLMWLLSSDCH